jgi:hypothetical protein
MKTELVLLGQHINIASQVHRRLLVVLIYAGFAALVIAWCFLWWMPTFGWLILLSAGALSYFLGGKYYRGGLLPPVDIGDEREMRRRDHAYFLAYSWWDLALFPALLAVGLKTQPFYAAWHPALRVFVDYLPYGLLIAAGILYYTLPQAILLWTEPDMEAEEPAK